MTRPRRFTNQALATVAAKTSAIEPVPSPISRPQVSTSCHAARASTDNPAPAAINSKPAPTTRRKPNRSISAAANGAVRP